MPERARWRAEGVGFEPTSKVTPASGFQDRRHRPLGELSGFRYQPDYSGAGPGEAVRHGCGKREISVGRFTAQQVEFHLRALLQVRVVGDPGNRAAPGG